jgi:tetratricopeptide (TPR) repeat protein
MRAFVFTDEALRAQAGRFVWLAIDTEREGNAPVVRKYPIDAWPTFMVVDPRDERVALRWVGGATAPQLQKLLDDARNAVAAPPPGSGVEAAFARAERLYGARDFAAAAAAYQEALKLAPSGWPRYGRAAESLVFALGMSGGCSTTLKLAGELLARVRHTSSSLVIADSALGCALGLPEGDAARAPQVAEFERAAREAVADPALVAAADDRSSVYGDLVQARKDAHDEAGARATAAEWAAFLEREAAKAATPDARTVFDSHRLTAYVEMGDPQRAIPMLEQSERDFPRDYNPPARLAFVYLRLKRWDQGVAAAGRALALAYGPRRIRILDTRAELLKGRGDLDQARATLKEALGAAEKLPEGQRSQGMIDALKKKIAALK